MVREIISAVSVATVLAMGAGSAAMAQQPVRCQEPVRGQEPLRRQGIEPGRGPEPVCRQEPVRGEESLRAEEVGPDRGLIGGCPGTGQPRSTHCERRIA